MTVQASTRAKGPPTKDCEEARMFIEHKAHTWSKREGWDLWCDGILPIDEQPPCQAYVSPEQPECGEPAPTTIHVKTQLINARVDVCKMHKKEHDTKSAARRQARATDENLSKAS